MEDEAYICSVKHFPFLILFFFSLTPLAPAQKKIPLPSPQQLKWHDMEFYLFTHFGPNTFTDKEWGLGDEPENAFNPTDLDCGQWCRIAKAAGAKGIIITAKHHDGFCLWPSKYSMHTVKQSSWKNGKGDVLKELSQACKKYGLKFGVYLSPWDRNHPKYGTPQYNDVFVNMMKEIFTNYGPIWEFWWDGANGEGPNGKRQVYDWPRFRKTIHDLSPNTVVFSDVGPHIRWAGNEKGIAGETNWNYLDTAGFTPGKGAPPTDTLNRGNINGKAWIPEECDVSIRPGWFYHKEEDAKVKTPEQLFNLYLKSVGRGANLLLNVPPDRRGLISANDSAALIGFKKLREENFKNNLLSSDTAWFFNKKNKSATNAVTDGKVKSFISITDFKNQSINIHYSHKQKINCMVLKEPIEYGQNISYCYIQLRTENSLQSFMLTTVGRKRIITFPAAEADDISFHVISGKGPIKLAEIEAYLIDEALVETCPIK